MDPPPSSQFPQPPYANNHPDSANSSPRSRPETWDDTSLAQIPGAKLRFMCSYGGHIIPRPHDKSLCYVGGETRIVVVERHSSLAELNSRLSHTLLNGRHFTLKYLLPTEDFDSLISVATDEDLENMIDEYDRSTAASPLKPSRLRLFLFPLMPETAASMGSLLDDAKSETWFVDALNGSGLLPRGLSESAGIDSLLELNRSESCNDLEGHNETSSLGNNNKQVVGKGNNSQEAVVLDLPPAVETTSSFGSSTSSPSMAHLPAIKVRVEDYQMVGLDEQFASHVTIASPPLPGFSTVAPPPKPVGGMSYAAALGGENPSRVVCDDEKSEKSDQGTVAPSGLRKPPLPLQPVQRKFVDIHNLPSPDSKHAGGYNLPSPDSVASDCSIASNNSLSKHTIYQDASQPPQYRDNRVPSPQSDPKLTTTVTQDHTSQIPPPQQQQQQNQPQFMHHPTTHYIHHSPVPMSTSYYPIYTQQPHDPQHYPVYLLPQTQQPCYDTTPSIVASTRPPVYPPKPEMGGNVYPNGGATPTQMLVQVPAHGHQFQQQYNVGISQIPATTQGGGGGPGGYGYEYSNHVQDQVYYAQHMQAAPAPAPPPPPPQYQTMTAATAVMLTQASAQLPADGNGQQ